MRNRQLAAAIGLALSASAVAQQDDWRADPNYDPEYGKLAAPRTNSHPIDTMIFLAEYGAESAQETLAEWEADPSWRERLHQREAYREYARARAARRLEQRLAKAEELGKARRQQRESANTVKTKPTSESPASPDLAGIQPGASQSDEVDIQAELEHLRSTIESITAERDELAAKLATLEEEHAELQLAHQELQSEHESLQVAHEALQSDHERVVAENERLTQDYAALQGRYDRLNAKHESLLARVHPPEPQAVSLSSLMSGRTDAAPESPTPPEGAQTDRLAATREDVDADGSLKALQRQGIVSEQAAALTERGLEALDDDRPAAALGWFLRAARAGSTNAMNNLGYLYEKGWGAIPSAQEALRWYERAAQAGHMHAMRNAARFYEHGIGVLEDGNRAAYWREQAELAEQELAQASEASENRG